MAKKSPPTSQANLWPGRLCQHCGLCCNGNLFADMELQANDNIQKLTALGLKVKRKGRHQCFPQPCPAHDGHQCIIYRDRPERCRTFECRQLQRVEAGEILESTAQKNIGKALRSAESVTRLCRACGNQRERDPLVRRYRAVMKAPMDLAADPEAADRRGELMMAMNDLMHLLHREFLT